jgi:hypothetical protein
MDTKDPRYEAPSEASVTLSTPTRLGTGRPGRVLVNLLAIAAAIAMFVVSANWLESSPEPLRVGVMSNASVKPVARESARVPALAWLPEYADVDPSDEGKRHRLVLEQVFRRNMPDTWDDWVSITVIGRKGTVVEFEVSPHGLRIGTNEDWVEVPMDGPHFAAAAELLGLSLAPAWMIEQIHLEARDRGGLGHYFAAAEIAQSMGYDDWEPNAPDGEKMKSPEFFERRSALIRDWLEEHQIADNALVSGYFKSVVPPIDGLTRPGGLEMVGGYSDDGQRIQPLSGGFHARTFFDYSHNVRLTKRFVRVDGKRVTLAEFWGNVDYALEFGFRRSDIPVPAYRYPEALARWMRNHGHAP